MVQYSPQNVFDYEANNPYIPVMTEIWQSPHWPQFTYDTAKTAPLLAAASAAMGEIAGLKEGLSPTDQDDLARAQLVQEALASFGIEGVALNADDVEASVVASLKHRDTAHLRRRSDAIADLMVAARAPARTLTPQVLQDWHRLLFFGIEVEDLGRWRSFDIEIVRSAVAGQGDVLFKAPPPDRVGGEMTRFLGWLNAPPAHPAPVTAAIAHLWFETIHPFSDGNGRIGRALIDHIFARTRPLPFSLSRQIERDKKGYYAALTAGRAEGQGGVDATAFVLWFLQTMVDAATAAKDEAMFLIRRNRFYLRHQDVLSPRAKQVLERLFAQGPERVGQGISARSYAKISGASPATATRDLTAMENAGVLERTKAGGRSTSYRIVF